MSDRASTTVELVLDAIVMTLDRVRPGWQHSIGHRRDDGLPRDGRAALLALAPARTLGRLASVRELHPEFLARADDDELRRLARRLSGKLSDRGRPLPEAVAELRGLRDHARRLRAFERQRGVPFGAALREAHERGRLAAFLDDLPPDAPPWSSAARAEADRAFAPRPIGDRRDVLRFLDRVGIPPDSDVAAALLATRTAVGAFVEACGVCSARARCSVCVLLERGLCSGQGVQIRCAEGRHRKPRGAALLSRGRRRVALLEARWRRLERSIRDPDLETLGRDTSALSERMERGLRVLEDASCASREERRKVEEGVCGVLSRLRSIDRARREHRFLVAWKAGRRGERSAEGEDQPLQG